jgi:mannose/fructose-specific phosphotransferase system component IIA
MTAVRAIVAAHGSLADGFVSAVQAISGQGAVLRAMSNTGMSSADVVAALARALDDTQANLVFTDLPAGSCTLAAKRLQRDRPGLTVISGVNLPLLLEFVLRDSFDGPELDAAVGRSRDHLRIMGAARVG